MDYQKSATAEEDFEPELKRTKDLQLKIEALEKENLTLKTNNTSELTMKVLELEQKLQNERMENDAQKKYQEMKQKEITDLRASHSQLNF